MLTPEHVDALQDKAGHIVDPIIDFLLEDIARRVSEAGQLTSTAAYQVYQAQKLGMSQREIKTKLKKLLKASRKEVNKLLTQAAEVGYRYDLERLPTSAAIPFEKNGTIQQIVSAAVKLAQDDLTNITQTLGMIDPYGNALPLQDVYRAATDFAFKQVITGATDYNTAIRMATKNLAEKGILSIDYESGVHTSLEAAVRRNIMGGLGLMNEQINEANHDALGCDGWEISAHANSAPDHEPLQGKQYPDKEYQALNNSLLRRIGTLNCGHVAFPIIMGVNEPQYTKEQLEKFRTDNEKGVTIDGKHYTGYEATQVQRKLERAIRKQKRRVLVDESMGDKKKLLTDKTKLQMYKQQYNRFSRAAGLRTEAERLHVAGFGRKTGDFGSQQIAREASKNLYDETAVSPFVKTAQYRRLYDNLDESKTIQRTACKKARAMLKHRSGTKFEDLTFIDTVSGRTMSRTDYNVENEVMPSRRMRAMVKSCEPHTVVAIHNHSGNSVPSMSDINSAYTHKYKYGLIACHNGTVMRYQVTGEYNRLIVDHLLDKLNRALYNDSAKKEELVKLLSQLKEENVVLEVFRQ